MSKSILTSTILISFCSFDLFYDFDVICIILIKTYKTFHCYFVKLIFYQLNIIKILHVLSLNTRMLTILLVVALRLKTFFETNKITIDYIIVDEIINKLTIDEKLKTRDKRT